MLEEVRTSCAAVMERATWVTIDHGRIPGYAASFTADERHDPIDGAADRRGAAREIGGDEGATEDRIALVMSLDAVNFGSGYHPVVHKRPGCSGAVTMARALREWAQDEGPLRPDVLTRITAADAHRIFGQPDDGGPCAELMGLFATALRDLGELVAADGSFAAFVARAGGSADRLVAQLDALPFSRDRARHGDDEVLFFKRAQITAADLAREFHGSGPGHFDDLDRLTAFADNLVPHVLRVDGLIALDPGLEARIDAGTLLAPGSAEEVELRAAGVHVVELLRAELAREGHRVRSSRLDEVLWTRGGAPRYKAVPRHRCRSVFY